MIYARKKIVILLTSIIYCFAFLSFQEDDTKKAAPDRGGKKEDGLITAVLKLDLHCEGCAKKVSRSVHHFEGTSTCIYV